jgi:hypothetical protein
MPSIVPKFREIRKNFIIGTYQSQEAIDTDDGSSYYQTHDNYFAFAGHGLKSDFGGQWNHHWNNVYGYVGTCFGDGKCTVLGFGQKFAAPPATQEKKNHDVAEVEALAYV